MERDWGGGLDYAFTVATLLAQKVSRNNAIYLRLRDEWESIFARLHQSCRTLTRTQPQPLLARCLRHESKRS